MLRAPYPGALSSQCGAGHIAAASGQPESGSVVLGPGQGARAIKSLHAQAVLVRQSARAASAGCFVGDHDDSRVLRHRLAARDSTALSVGGRV
eukprot:2304058-Rhodomonas_salina.2